MILAAGCRSGPPRTEIPSPTEMLALLAQGSGPNVAATVDGASDPRLLPHAYPLPPLAVAHTAVAAIESLPRWEVVAGRDGVLWATRRTRLFRFTDDIFLLLVPGRDSTVVYARSASRVGHSDLGQNRRNLAELWRALDAAVRARETAATPAADSS